MTAVNSVRNHFDRLPSQHDSWFDRPSGSSQVLLQQKISGGKTLTATLGVQLTTPLVSLWSDMSWGHELSRLKTTKLGYLRSFSSQRAVIGVIPSLFYCMVRPSFSSFWAIFMSIMGNYGCRSHTVAIFPEMNMEENEEFSGAARHCRETAVMTQLSTINNEMQTCWGHMVRTERQEYWHDLWPLW